MILVSLIIVRLFQKLNTIIRLQPCPVLSYHLFSHFILILLLVTVRSWLAGGRNCRQPGHWTCKTCCRAAGTVSQAVLALTYLFVCFYSVKHVCATLRMITSHIQVFVCFHFTDTSSDPRSRRGKQHES